MSKTKITKGQIVLYAIITCVSNLIAAFLVSAFLKTLLPFLNNNVVVFIILLILGVFALSLGIAALFFKRKVPDHYQTSNNQYNWLKQAFRLILPGEIVRFLLCLFSLGQINSTGLLSIIPTFLFEQTYVIWTGRIDAIRQKADYIPADFFAYIGAYLPYLIIYLVGILTIYRFFWNVGKREREEMIVHESKPRYY